MAGLPDFGKMLGPLPLGAWLAVVGGGLGIAIYTRQQNAGASTAPTIVDDTGGMTGVGTGGTGDWIPIGGPTTAPAVVTDTTPSNNDEWGRAAINYLIAQGYDSAVSDAAVRKYLAGGETMSIQEYALIRIALMKICSLPTPLPPPISPIPVIVKPPVVVTPAPPKQAPPPVKASPKPPVKAPAPKPAIRYYVVVPGDNLSKIATRYYGRPDWQRIYNANRNIIINPNLIRPGQRLVIP